MLRWGYEDHPQCGQGKTFKSNVLFKKWSDAAIHFFGVTKDPFRPVNRGGRSMMLEKGLRGEATVTVSAGNTAKEVGSGSVSVFATPMLMALMESAAIKALQGRLPEGQTTVGTRAEISHTAATPVGMTVTAQAELVEADGRRLVFDVMAQDEAGLVGEGRHERFIVETEKFLSKAEKRKGHNAWMDS
jgi:predicted thioesterase